MKRFYHLVVVILFCVGIARSQEFDLIYSAAESGLKTHFARNSITLDTGYTYSPGGNSLTIGIQNPVVTGTVTYGTTVDPEGRTLNTTSYLVGATNGSFTVNPMGGASYTIPLELLPGVNGLAPELSLVYSSNSGPGIAGYGWQIAGLSSIGRGPKTVYHDGAARGVDLDTTDRFYIDGQRLVPTYDYVYGNPTAEYQTDVDLFTRVKQYGTDAYGPGYFKAETKSGLVCEYGNTTASKQKISGYAHVVNWYVSKVSDLFGNQIDFSYIKDNYNVYPVEIKYGTNNCNTITFYYKEKDDKNYSYLKGTRIEQRLILDKITVMYNTSIVKTYEFKYNYLGTNYNYNSILNEIIEYGAGTSRVNSTAISYQIPENVSFSQAIYNTSETYISYNSKLFSGDFNGDGKADIFCIPSGGGWRYYKGNGDNTFTLSASGDFSVTESSISKLMAVDLNGDNYDDLVFCTLPLSKYYYAISTGTTFGSDIYFGELLNSLCLVKRTKSSAGDLNGDGLNDCIIVNPNGELKIYSYQYSNGQLTVMGLRNTFNFGTSVGSDDIIYLSDFNGDGMADIWKINGSGIRIYAVRGPALIDLYSNAMPDKNHFFMPGDFNGDGKTDIFLYGHITGDWTEWQLRLSTGTGFEAFYIPQKKANLKNDKVRQGDFNGDGCTDIMVTAFDDNGWTGHYYYIAKNRGTDFYSHFYSSGQAASNNYNVDDYYGDGRDSYLVTDGLSPWWTGYMIYRAPGRTNTLIEKIGNGLGFLTKLTYTKLSQASGTVYQRGTAAAFPVSDYSGPVSVVSSIQYDNGLGAMNTQNYYYEGIKIHRQGKGLMGYTKTRVTDVTSGIETESQNSYNTTYFYPQLLRTSSKRTGTTDTIEKTTRTWSQLILDIKKKRIFPYMQTSVTVNKLTGHTVTMTSNYDIYGNPLTITKSYSNGPTETTTNTYNNTVSSTKWLLGRPAATTVQYSQSGSTTITRSGTRVFDSNNNHLKSETWFAGSDNHIKHRYLYYSYGNLQKRIDSINNNITRSLQYEYETNKVRVWKVTDPLSHVTTNTYDTYGRLSTLQDYLGNTVTYQYDNLHRQTNVSVNDGSGATTVYAWQDPLTTPLLARYSIETTGNNGSKTRVWYDKLGREIRSDLQGFDGVMVYKSTEYNNKGQVYRVSEPYLPSKTAEWNTITYDNYGRRNGLTTPLGMNSTWQYVTNTVTETTAGKSFVKTFASDGSLSSATDAGGTINYTYFPDGKVKTIVAPGSITTSMQYDNAGNQTQLNDPSAGIITYTYNGFGELTNQQNARSQTTQLTYYADGRPYQKIASAEGTTTYNYNANKQLTGISSPGGVDRSFVFDGLGRVTKITETLPGPGILPVNTNFTYDNKGRLSTIKHPSSITETNNYNSYGYLCSVSTDGVTRWTITGRNAYQQDTSGTYGSILNVTFGHNKYGYPRTTVTGTLQDYKYNFNTVTGNLNWRQNNKYTNLKEDFQYDNLNRLDNVYKNGAMMLDMAYEPNKGGITTKSDAGTLNYSLSNKKYAVSSINPSTGLITSAMNDSVTYTSFESIKTISEGTYNATFTYNADNQRAKMTVLNGSSLVLSRWYPGSSYIRDSTGTGSKSYTFIGGDAYTAPVVAVKQGNGTPVYYYLLRDYLGSITHVINASNNTVAAEYSYDSWGRMRDPATWVNYTPGQETDLMIAGRGFTGHEHLKWFKLINMNGRMYDPLTGQFLSPDNYVQAPGFTQSYNRYGYCLNNPLKYTDPSGENWWNWLLGGIFGGAINVIANWDDIDGDFIKFNQYAFVGCVAGSTAAWLADHGVLAPGIGMASGWLLSTGNSYIRGARGSEVLESGTQGALWGGVSGFSMKGLSGLLNEAMNIPWTTDYSGVPGNGNEVTLGKAFSRLLGSRIRDYIAEQGIANAEVILAAYNPIGDYSRNIVLFDYARDGLEYMWDQSNAMQKELGAFITDKGLLVLPYYKNTFSRAYWDYVKYAEDNHIVIAGNNEYAILSNVHTHLGNVNNGIGISGWDIRNMNYFRFKSAFVIYKSSLFEYYPSKKYKFRFNIR